MVFLFSDNVLWQAQACTFELRTRSLVARKRHQVLFSVGDAQMGQKKIIQGTNLTGIKLCSYSFNDFQAKGGV